MQWRGGRSDEDAHLLMAGRGLPDLVRPKLGLHHGWLAGWLAVCVVVSLRVWEQGVSVGKENRRRKRRRNRSAQDHARSSEQRIPSDPTPSHQSHHGRRNALIDRSAHRSIDRNASSIPSQRHNRARSLSARTRRLPGLRCWLGRGLASLASSRSNRSSIVSIVPSHKSKYGPRLVCTHLFFACCCSRCCFRSMPSIQPYIPFAPKSSTGVVACVPPAAGRIRATSISQQQLASRSPRQLTCCYPSSTSRSITRGGTGTGDGSPAASCGHASCC